MQDTQIEHLPKPYAPKPRDPRTLSAYRHGLTGQIVLLTPADRAAYEKHCEGYHQSFAPASPVETDVVQLVANDRWRLKYAVSLEAAMWADSITQPDGVTSGNDEVDTAIAQGRAWMAKGGNVQLLGLYESRMARRVEKNMSELRTLQTQRRADLDRVVEEYDLVAQLAVSNCENYDPKLFPRETLPPGFVFSLPEIVRLVAHRRRLAEARKLAPLVRKSPKLAAQGKKGRRQRQKRSPPMYDKRSSHPNHVSSPTPDPKPPTPSSCRIMFSGASSAHSHTLFLWPSMEPSS